MFNYLQNASGWGTMAFFHQSSPAPKKIKTARKYGKKSKGKGVRDMLQGVEIAYKEESKQMTHRGGNILQLTERSWE